MKLALEVREYRFELNSRVPFLAVTLLRKPLVMSFSFAVKVTNDAALFDFNWYLHTPS